MLTKADIKYINSLQNKKYRKIEHAFLVEGLKNVLELIHSDFQIERIFCTEAYQSEIKKSLDKRSVPVEIVNEKELTQISTLETNTTALAIAKTKEHINITDIQYDRLIIALDAVNDPGNLGTIIRIADWYGIKDIVCSADTVDVYNPKVINATKGSFARVNVHYTDLAFFLSQNKEIPILAACMEGESIYKVAKQLPAILLMGNEANGISANLLACVTDKISIPRIGGAESLNVGVATGIIVDRLLN